MRKLKINFDEIQKAMEDTLRDTFDYFFDMETGDVMTYSGEVLDEMKSRLYDDEYEEIQEDIEYIEFDEEPQLPDWMLDEVDIALEILLDETGRYVRIPERNSDTAFKSMAEFIETVKNPELREKLTHALNGKRAFRKFKDILTDYPKERKRWHGYNAKAMKKEITGWLMSIGVEPVS
ncbi:MAG: UPF0158 family protein [Nitrospirota bacterium]